ncbi:helix-turn-helix transcriptional regulator [Actinomadura sp. 7K534]|uniref:helix-turn-helix domain-containing protein n=1 Tax=Actinomadura sp. 7K534 TaxID=2530366 RepID=UPI00104908BE|nr:helix-turn-helix transcriptional regulator [Actinomadura sp. 7K534]TDB90724.1 XRE family transcriptional regulator [Actinomadura sp. 7K534]
MTERDTAFGTELRRRRLAVGLSLSQLAARIHYTKGYLSKIETGRKLPSPDMARRCDTVLNAEGELAALVERPTSGAPDEPDLGDRGDAWLLRLGPVGDCEFVPATPSDTAPESSDDAVPPWHGASRRALAAAANAERIDATLAVFRSQFEQARVQGQVMPPDTVLPTVITQTNTLRALAAVAAEPERGRLLLLAARCAEFVGWMTQEKGNDQRALWWTRTATRLVEPTGDPAMAAYAMVRRAEMALYRDDAVQVIRLARAAQEQPGVPPRVRGLAAQREAQGLALYGDHDGYRRGLERASALLEAAKDAGGDEPIIGSSTGSDLDPVVAGWCLHDLGCPEEAAELLDQALPLIAARGLRARLRFGTRRALAYAAAGEIDRACELTSELLDLVDVVDSATIRVDLRRLARSLVRRHAHPSVREIYPRIMTALHTATA